MSYISENLYKLMFREMEPPKKTFYISGVNFLSSKNKKNRFEKICIFREIELSCPIEI